MAAEYTYTTAELSDCGRYRYQLQRRWGGEGSVGTFILLNPSTADAEEDDPTIRRCVAFARKWGHSGINVVNLFAYRATDKSELQKVEDPVGPLNDSYILETLKGTDSAVAAWGNDGAYLERGQKVRALCERAGVSLSTLAITKSGEPGHPLYLPGNATLERLV